MAKLRSLPLAILVVGAASDAQALTCAPAAGGQALASDILVLCSYCIPDDAPATALHGTSPETNAPDPEVAYAVEEVERSELVGGGVSLRYEASEPLPVGNYVLQLEDFQLPVRAVADTGPPQLPAVRLTGYQMGESAWGPVRSAHFQIEGVNGTLVADAGDPDEDPMRNVQSSGQVDVASFTFGLGVDLCTTSLAEADYGVTTRVRFGTLAPNGDFSGWTEWVDVDYPQSEGDYVVDERGAVEPVSTPILTGPNEAAGGSGSVNENDGGTDDPVLDEDVARVPVDGSSESTSGCSLRRGRSLRNGGVAWLLLVLGMVGVRSARCPSKPLN